ncbi:MAG: hypothetical protein RH862_15900 [Leptospiraceae bacterium]
MLRQARILPQSCREDILADLATRANSSAQGLLTFLIEGERSPENPASPLDFFQSTSQLLKEEFLEFAHGLLLFPEEDKTAVTRGEAEHLHTLSFSCGASALCCLRSGRVLAEFAILRKIPSELIILESEPSGNGPSAGAVLSKILKARRDSGAMERLANEHSSYFFLAAGYVGGPFQKIQTDNDLEDIRNRALQNSEN